MVPGLLAHQEVSGLRELHIRSDGMATVCRGCDPIPDTIALAHSSRFSLTSPVDPAYRERARPLAVSRFSNAVGCASGPFDWLAQWGHFLHLRPAQVWRYAKGCEDVVHSQPRGLLRAAAAVLAEFAARINSSR
jgi:hypothetical protein